MSVDGKTVLYKDVCKNKKRLSAGTFILGVGEIHQSTEGGTTSLKVDVITGVFTLESLYCLYQAHKYKHASTVIIMITARIK